MTDDILYILILISYNIGTSDLNAYFVQFISSNLCFYLKDPFMIKEHVRTHVS